MQSKVLFYDERLVSVRNVVSVRREGVEERDVMEVKEVREGREVREERLPQLHNVLLWMVPKPL